MYQIAINDEREELFINTAAKMGITPAIVEKYRVFIVTCNIKVS